MRPLRNLRVRFAALTTIVFFAGIMAYDAFVFVTLDFFLHASVRDSLRLGAEQIVVSLDPDSGKLKMPSRLIDLSDDVRSVNLFTVALLDEGCHPLMQEGPFASDLPKPESAPSRPFYQIVDPDLYVYTMPISAKGKTVGIIQFAQSTETIERVLKGLLAVLAISLPFFMLGSACCGYFLAARLLRPIDVMTRTARKFSEEDLSARLGLPETDDELGRLATTFDEMLARIETSFTHYRQFTADASHELRTPVSVMQAILSVTNRRPRTVEEYRAAMDDLKAAADRLESLVAALMAMSREDMAPAVPTSRVDVSDLLLGTLESLRPLADDKGLSLIPNIGPNLAATGDSDALLHVFINVVDNAIKYTERGSVTVRAEAVDGGISIEVADTGIGIEASNVPRIFDRFFRADRSRTTGGSGLGLAISRAIVERHGGTIGAKSSPGVGTTVRIFLPAR